MHLFATNIQLVDNTAQRAHHAGWGIDDQRIGIFIRLNIDIGSGCGCCCGGGFTSGSFNNCLTDIRQDLYQIRRIGKPQVNHLSVTCQFQWNIHMRDDGPQAQAFSLVTTQ